MTNNRTNINNSDLVKFFEIPIEDEKNKMYGDIRYFMDLPHRDKLLLKQRRDDFCNVFEKEKIFKIELSFGKITVISKVYPPIPRMRKIEGFVYREHFTGSNLKKTKDLETVEVVEQSVNNLDFFDKINQQLLEVNSSQSVELLKIIESRVNDLGITISPKSLIIGQLEGLKHQISQTEIKNKNSIIHLIEAIIEENK
jgi:hypothetical protein